MSLNKPKNSQSGSVLGISLLLLLVMTLIGVIAAKIALSEQKMAGNTRSQEVALQAAEFGLRDAEHWLNNLTELPHEVSCSDSDDLDCADISGAEVTDANTQDAIGAVSRVLRSDDPEFSDWETLSGKTYAEWQSFGQAIKQTDDNDDRYTVAGAAQENQPRYIVRELRFIPDGIAIGTGVPPGRYLYEVTAVGVGTQDTTKRVVQSTFIRRF